MLQGMRALHTSTVFLVDVQANILLISTHKLFNKILKLLKPTIYYRDFQNPIEHHSIFKAEEDGNTCLNCF